MIRSIKNIVWSALNTIPIGPLLQLYMVGEIRTNGWMRTFSTKKSTDFAGNPIPWWTYPMVDFLKERLNKSINIFEYGCGGSTKWLSSRVGSINAVEDHQGWKEFAEKDLPNNVSIF